MKEKNREEIAESLYMVKGELESIREERARLLDYNKKKADILALQITELEKELVEKKRALAFADAHFEEAPPHIPTLEEELCHLLAPLNRYMQKGAAALRSKRRRILFLFARHPKVVLAQMLHQAATEAEKVQKKMARFKNEPHFLEISQFLETLVDHSKKRWNHALYDGEFLDLYDEWAALYSCLGADA
ncbi:MAG: hypothetical protein H7A36_05515 [Chlamydiales bacterium]|nr:hypothetical protein [Chlamydiales bacterium]